MAIEFYRERDKPYGCFSNFSPHGFELEGQFWKTAEHYFQAQKFAGTPYADRVREAPSPAAAKAMGRSHPMREDWEQVKDDVMRQAVRAKFLAHPEIREILLSTGAEEIVEAAPRDYYWGAGADGSGRNMLGKILVEVREELRGQPS